MTAAGSWIRDEQHTVLDLLRDRVEASPDDPYLDVVGHALTAGEVSRAAARIGGALRAIGVQPGDRVATLIENSAEAVLAWWGIVLGRRPSPCPINTAYKGEYLRHQLADSGSRVLVVEADLADRAGGGRRRRSRRSSTWWSSTTTTTAPSTGAARPIAWADLLGGRRRATRRRRAPRPTWPPSSTPAAPPARPRAACSATTTTRP